MATVLIFVCVTLVTSFAENIPEQKFDFGVKIVGGSTALDGAYPYMASLLQNNRHFCGASIINREWILTAAHCVKGFPVGIYTIRVGSNQWNSGGAIYRVFRIYIHERYSSVYNKNDLAVLNVQPITFTTKVQPILLDHEEVRPNTPCIFTGWGKTGHPLGWYPNDLQQIALQTVSVNYCNEKNREEICTFTKTGEGICYADSGSPLVRSIGNWKKQIGISSKSGRLCALGKPDIFVRISAYIPWIQRRCNCVVN